MIVGILSDTHGYQHRTAAAVALLEHLGAQAFIHCGDVGGAAVLDEFVGRKLWFVLGNTDALDPMLLRYAESLGLHVPDSIPLQIEIAGRNFAVYHGHESHFNRLLRAVRYQDHSAVAMMTRGLDYILYGHTHTAAETRVGHTRLINPGALERARPHTVATLDLERNELKYWQVDESFQPGTEPHPFTPRQ